jgi:hypothetical protein
MFLATPEHSANTAPSQTMPVPKGTPDCHCQPKMSTGLIGIRSRRVLIEPSSIPPNPKHLSGAVGG